MGILSATRLLSRCLGKCCTLLLHNSSWWWAITCLKHVEVKLSELNYLENCASCWSHWRVCITMHGSENVKKKHYCPNCICMFHDAIVGMLCILLYLLPIFLFSPFFNSFLLLYFSPSLVFSFSVFFTLFANFDFDSLKRLVDPLNSLFSCWPPGARWERRSIVLFLLWETVNTLKPAEFRCYCMCSSSVREVAYTNGAVTHVQFLSCLALSTVTKWLLWHNSVISGTFGSVDDADDCCFEWALFNTWSVAGYEPVCAVTTSSRGPNRDKKRNCSRVAFYVIPELFSTYR